MLTYTIHLLLNLRSPRDYVVRSSFRPSVVCSRLWYVLDRQLLNGWSHRHQNRRLCSRPHSHESVIVSNFWDSYFSSYGEFGEFSLRFTAAVSAVAQRSLSGRSAVAQRSLCLQRKRLILHYTKIGDAGCIRLHVCSTPSTSPSWTLDQPGTVSGQGAAYASGPTLRDRRDDEQRGSPYDAKCNVAEIGVVNMGEIGAVRKRSR